MVARPEDLIVTVPGAAVLVPELPLSILAGSEREINGRNGAATAAAGLTAPPAAAYPSPLR